MYLAHQVYPEDTIGFITPTWMRIDDPTVTLSWISKVIDRRPRAVYELEDLNHTSIDGMFLSGGTDPRTHNRPGRLQNK